MAPVAEKYEILRSYSQDYSMLKISTTWFICLLQKYSLTAKNQTVVVPLDLIRPLIAFKECRCYRFWRSMRGEFWLVSKSIQPYRWAQWRFAKDEYTTNGDENKIYPGLNTVNSARFRSEAVVGHGSHGWQDCYFVHGCRPMTNMTLSICIAFLCARWRFVERKGSHDHHEERV